MLSALIALTVTFQAYPFIGLADGFSRWGMALDICENRRVTTPTLLSPVIPYIQAATYKITNSYGMYTFLQVLGFYFSIGILTKILIGNFNLIDKKNSICAWNILSILIILFPSVYVFPMLLTDSAPVFIIIIFLYALKISILNRLVKCVCGILLISLCVGIRVNSVAMFGLVAMLYIAVGIYHRNTRKIFIAMLIIIGSLLGVTVSSKLVPGHYNASTLGMIWELTGIVAETGDTTLKEKISEFGNIEEAVKRYGEPYLNSITWDNEPPFPAMYISSAECAPEITKIYVQEMLHHPKRFIKNKFDFIEKTLGISDKLITSARGIHGVDEGTQAKGAIDTCWQNKLRADFIGFTDGIGIISQRPWIAIAFSLALIVVCIMLKRNGKCMLQLWEISVAYYSSFCINTQAFEFRYYAPTFYILLCIIICAIVSILEWVYMKCGFQRKKRR